VNDGQSTNRRARASGNETEVEMLSKVLCACAALAVFCGPAAANSMSFCGERAKIVEVLNTKYQEARLSGGIIGQEGSGVMELFVSKKGTWTILATMAEGKTCIVAAGQSWQDMPEKVAGTGT
jgi:hypothetical protein